MSPIQLRNELARRILDVTELDPMIPQLLGIDLKTQTKGEDVAAFPALPYVDEDEIYSGVVDFDLKVGVLGREQTLDCRAIYSATLVDDRSIVSMFMGGLDECEVIYQRLKWEPSGSARWVPLDPGDLLTQATRRTIEAMILHDAQQQQEAEE